MNPPTVPSVRAVQCGSCGGAVANPPGDSGPRCLFCGRADLHPFTVPAGVERPESWLPFEVGESAALGAFRGWASRRFWAPSDLKHAKVAVHRLFLPAWMWSGEIETHWAALVPAATRSGKRPLTGQERGIVRGVLVPSSPAMSVHELEAIAPFDDSKGRDLGEEEVPEAYEVGVLTRAVARSKGVDRMAAQHGREIGGRIGASKLNSSAMPLRVDGRPMLLPVWIGAYLYGEASHRVVINGQTGAVTGTSPVAWWKVALAVLAGLLALLVIVGVLSEL